MKHLWIALLVTFILPSSAMAICFVKVDGKYPLSAAVVEETAIAELSLYVEEVDEIPVVGISESDCVYNLNLTDMKPGFMLVVKGPTLVSYAESKLPGLRGFQQALLKSIIKELPGQKQAICQKHNDLLSMECGLTTKASEPVSKELTVFDPVTQLTWQKTEAGKMEQDKAIPYCNNLDLAGYLDWRLPSQKEIKSSIAIKGFFPDLVFGRYWSSSAVAGERYYAWGITMPDGNPFQDWIKNRYQVRCVRGEEMIGISDDLSVELETQEKTTVQQTEPANYKNSSGLHYVIAPSLVTGLLSVYDLYIHNIKESDGFDQTKNASDNNTIFGAAFAPYFQFDSGFRFSGSIGPPLIITASTTTEDEEFTYSMIPFEASLGYALTNGVYFLAGISKPNADGDFVVAEHPGVTAAIGFERKSNSLVSLGVEAGYNASSVDFKQFDCSDSSQPNNLETCQEETVTINPAGLVLRFLIVF